jgi:phage shock protein C
MAVTPGDRRLHRSRRDRVFLGVCGGLGEYFASDPLFIRLVFVFIALTGGIGILAYLLLAIILPEEGAETATGQDGLRRNLASLRTNAGEIAGDLRASLGSRTEESGMESDDATRQRRTQQLGGLVLIGLGLIFFASNLGWFAWFDWGTFWPLILIIIGLAILIRRDRPL